MPDDFDPPLEFFEECAKHCRCCRDCGDAPCAGSMAGGLCDNMRCRCNDDSDYYDSDDD